MLDEIMWLFVVLSLYGNLLVIQKNQNGFAVWITTNSAWVIYDIYIGVYSQAVLFFIYNLFAIYGYLSWRYQIEVNFWTFLIKGYIRNVLKTDK